MAIFGRSKQKPEEAKKQGVEKKASGVSAAKPARAKKPARQAQGKRSGRREKIAYRVIVRPQITEKAGRLNEMNQYVFRVHKNAKKQEIAQAIQELYGVKPIRVNTIKIPGKTRRLGRTTGTIPGYKKAIVTIPEGKKIEVTQH